MVPLVLFNGAPSDAKSLSLAGFQQILQLGLQENQQGKKAPALVRGRNRPSSPAKKERKRERKRNYPEGVWLSSLLTVTWMPTLNGFRRRMTVQPPRGGMGANAQRFPKECDFQPPHGDMDDNTPRLLPWCTAETAPAPPPKTCDCPASSR